MAGLFGFFDYTKEGKGVYPDDPEKGPVGTFFAVLGRKFWKICTINLMYVVLSIPALLLSFFLASYVLSVIAPGMTMDTLITIFKESGIVLQEGVTMEEFAASQLLIIYVAIGALMTGLSLIIVGPVHAGITYLLRNYSQEEHAFVWLDFKEHAKNNWKQSLAACVISIIVTLLLTVNYAFYSSREIVSNPWLSTILRTTILIIFVIWCIIQMYLYPMMITFDLKLKQLYKNCLLFSIMRLPLNILIFLISMILMFVLPAILLLIGYGISMIMAVIWYLFLGFGINLLMTNLFVYRGLDKYMISRLNQPDEEEAEETEAESAEEKEIDPEQNEADKNEDEDEDEEEAGGFVESPSGARS